MPVSKRLRYEVLRRDNHTCRYCGATAPDVPLRIDHVTPVALGGSDDPTNLVTSCEPCNSGKTSSAPDAPLVDGIAQDALRWSAAMKQAADNLRQQEKPKADYRAAFKTTWDSWTYESRGNKHTFDLPAGWKTSIDNFRQAGVPVEVWPDIVERAMTNKMLKADNLFRYCCGIAWRMVGELQEEARRILRTGQPEPTARNNGDRAAFRRSVFVCLGVVWEWAWTRAHDDRPSKAAITKAAEQLWEWTGDGTSATVDLVEVAFVAGTDRSTDLSLYLPPAPRPPEE